ncbi:MBL fold metallo-hydrolase [Mesorhizobium sp. DCY119]|uniref:MBL fold metallo-hydrolase n=1 Tax=Mesorhizobium sp. DCY119 TaxID=2108445 RepID=UPI000E7611E9|nr:MBL fold metallo-hydrolase [Mesorhizobium sp. DCY119]RJG40867.1 MBL fold metallo-hydrolase [Mesorhizobium sp. DCY119]
MTVQKSPLDFPWKAPPASGEVTEVAPGLLWARLPLPFRLDHVNVWLLEEDDGWTVIDTGCATPEILAVWERLLAGPMRGKPVRRVVATHGHVDHIGLTGWLVQRFDADFIGTFAEWVWARLSHTHDVPGSSATHHSYLVRHGFDDEDAGRLVQSRRRFIDLSSQIPGWITEIRNGDAIRLGGLEWRVIVTRGHAFEHASFYNEESGILIVGDHILPRISPVIAVYEMMPKADPLGDYLDSFPQFDGIPADTLILPSHGLPYRGVHQRIAELRDHHRLRLDATASFLSNPSTALELSREMFPHIEGPDNIGFALGETLAHVNYLVARNIVEERLGDQGRTIFALRR